MSEHDFTQFDIRPVDNDTLPQYIDLCSYCFGGTPADYEQYVVGDQELACSLAAFDGERMACGMRYFPFDMRIRGTFVGMGGVAAVGTWPEYRNRGLVRELLSRLQVMMRDEGRPLSVLMPFKFSYYYDMGWASTFDCVLAEFEGRKLRPLPAEGYTLRKLVGSGEWEILEALNSEYGARYNGPVCRSQSYWERRYFQHAGKKREIYLVERDGEPRGFVVCRLSEPEGTAFARDLLALQAVWLDAGAERAVFNFFRSHRDQVRKVMLYLPPDVSIGHLFDNPEIERKLKPKMMTKLVDVKAAIEAIGYDQSLSDGLWLRVAGDRTAPWNDGLWRLEFADGKASVSRAEEASEAVEISVQHLAQLYMGYRTVAELHESLEISGPDDQLETLAAAFPAYPTYIDDWF